MIKNMVFENECYNSSYQISNIINHSTKETIKNVMYLAELNGKLKPRLEKTNKKYFFRMGLNIMPYIPNKIPMSPTVPP